MRSTLTFLTVAALALALPSAAAQDEPGCLQSNPCDITIDVDALGLDLSQALFTAGDWVFLSVYNDDDVPHTLTLSGHDVTVVVPPYDIVETDPFQLSRSGTYELRDSPSGDSADLVVEPEEAFTSQGSDGDGNGIPALAPFMLAMVVAGAAALVRRRVA